MAKKQLPPGWGNATSARKPDWDNSVIQESAPSPAEAPAAPVPDAAPAPEKTAPDASKSAEAPSVPEKVPEAANPAEEASASAAAETASPAAPIPNTDPIEKPAATWETSSAPAPNISDTLPLEPAYLSETETYPTPEEIPKKQGSSKLMVLLAAVLILLLAALVVLGYLFYFGNRQSTEDSVAEVAITETTVSAETSTTVLETTTSIITTETTTVSSEAPTEASTETPTEAPTEAARSTAQSYSITYAMYGEINCHGGRVDSFSSVYVLDGGAREIVRTSLGNGWHITAVRYCYNYGNYYYECYDSDDGDYYGWVDGNYIDFYSYTDSGSNWNNYGNDNAEIETQAVTEETTPAVAPEPSVKTKAVTVSDVEFEYDTYYYAADPESDSTTEFVVNALDIVPPTYGNIFDVKVDATLSGSGGYECLKYTTYDAEGYELSNGTLVKIEAATKKTESLLVPSDAARVVIEFSYD